MFREEFKVEGEELTIKTNNTPKKEKEILEQYIIETEMDKIKKDLRQAGIKIKNISPTNFGTEFIFFSKADAITASDIMGTSKIKNNSVFVG